MLESGVAMNTASTSGAASSFSLSALSNSSGYLSQRAITRARGSAFTTPASAAAADQPDGDLRVSLRTAQRLRSHNREGAAAAPDRKLPRVVSDFM
jgi:hypothetical protein